MKIQMYDDDAVAEIIAEATRHQTVKQWLAKIAKNVHRFIMNHPREYRTFGIYWWVLKKHMVDSGYMTGMVDKEYYGLATTGDLKKDIAIAMALHVSNADSFGGYSQRSNITFDDGDVTEYILYDQEMEELIQLAKS